MGPSSTFKEQHREFEEIARELNCIRQHNLRFKEGDDQASLMLIAEGAMVLIALERFLRIVVPDATNRDTLPNLIEKATRRKDPIVTLPGDRDTVKAQLSNVRNTLLHGNYEQAARQTGRKDVTDYFRFDYAAEVETLYKVLEDIVSQIDPSTGKRVQGRAGVMVCADSASENTEMESS